MIERFVAGEVVEGGLGHAGGELLRAETVAPADDAGGTGEGRAAFGERGEDVEEERFADGAGLLGAVEDGDGLHGLGQGGEKSLHVEGVKKAHGDDAGFLAGGVEVFGGFAKGVDRAAHGDDDAFGVGVAVVVEEVVFSAG